MQNESLLIEIGTEELPPVHLDKLGASWLEAFKQELEKLKVPFGEGKSFVAPRRIAILLEGVPSMTQPQAIQKRGPAVKAAFDSDGKPTQAAIGFAKSNNTTVESLNKIETDKGEWLVFDTTIEGLSSDVFIPQAVKSSVSKIPIGKKMRWGDESFEFIRPVHWLVALHGSHVIPLDLFGIQSNNQSLGHRFHHPGPITIPHASDYLETMKKANVIADYTEREMSIKENAQQLAASADAKVVMEPDLLDLVVGLNEWPKPMVANFDADFLSVPQEALITAMQHHQKCFPLLDKDNKLLPKFVLTANTDAQPATQIIDGNERVMHARLSDAQFFFKQDCKKPLDTHLEGLKLMIFQKKLGTLFDKTKRLEKLAQTIANSIDAPPHHAKRAATLSKCDLLTEMVGEFPELQGIMGYYYALANQESNDVAVALKEAYLPRFSKDDLPATPTGLALSLADRLDTLVGIFGIGKAPTGDKDPFGLRRACLGVLRIMVEKQLNLDLKELLKQAHDGFRAELKPDVVNQILSFCFERFKAWYQEKGVSAKTIDAVMATKKPSHPLDFAKRIEAVSHFQSLPESESLSAANKRVRNILTKSGLEINFDNIPDVNPEAFQEQAESALFEKINQLQAKTKPFVASGEYTQVLSELAQLRTPVDAFFDQVMVNVDDEATRNNRLNLLTTLHNLFGQVADISRLS